MKGVLLILALLPTAAPSQGVAALAATAHYISTTGNDANPGTAASPWLTPNHAVNCADILWASAGTYTAGNFHTGKWGTVGGGTCAYGMARLMCSTFDGCKINANNDYGIYVDKSYWSVQGWEVSTTANAGCPGTPSLCGFTAFAAAPTSTSGPSIHHIAFINDIANGAGGGGFSGFNQGTFSVDYIAFVGNIAYNAAQNSTNCYSGLTIFQPLKSDSVAGTHLYVGGNFAWHNIDPNPCAGVTPNGENGYISDTKDGSQGLGVQYDQQEYVENNIFVGNGAQGLQEQSYTANPAASSPTYWKHNTMWGNLVDPNFNNNLCVEMLVNKAYSINADHNIAQTTVATTCTGHTTYASYTYDTCGSLSSNCKNGTASYLVSTIATNWFYSASGSGTTTGSFNDEGNTPPNTFTFGTNSAGGTPVSPAFTSPAVPGAPSCGSASSVYDCMNTAGVITNFTPTAIGTTGFGYQVPSNMNGSDALFPKWLCPILPAGLVNKSC